MKDNALSKYHIEKDINMSDSKIKVSQMPRANGLNSQDMLYVTVVDNDELHSKRCDISTLTETISVDVGIGNIKNDVNSHTASINTIDGNITAINKDLIEHAENIDTLSANTTQLSTTVNQHSSQITDLQLSAEQATNDKLGTIKVGYSSTDNANHAVQLDSDGRAYVTVAGGGGGEDTELRKFINATSSYYAQIKQPDKYENKVEILATDVSLSNAAFVKNIQQLCVDIITGPEKKDPHSLSINFEHFRSAVAGLSVDPDPESTSNEIEISSGILYDLISTDSFTVTGTVLSGSTITLRSSDLHKDNYLAIGIQLTSSNANENISIGNRYIDNTLNASYVCIDVNNQADESQNVTINGIVTYIYTSKVFYMS